MRVLDGLEILRVLFRIVCRPVAGRLRGEGGQILPIFAIGMVSLLGFAAFGVDIGNWRYQQRAIQSVDDSAAVAGANALSYSSTANVQQAALTDAADNGTVPDGVKVFVTAQVGPTAGEYVGRTDAVEAIVEKKVPTFFSVLLGRTYQDIRVRSVAVVSNASRACIYALDPHGLGIVGDGVTISIPKCGVVSNSSLTLHGATVDARSIAYSTTLVTSGTNFVQASPTVSVPGPDPCHLYTGCSYFQTFTPSPVCAATNLSIQSQFTTLFPGTYCGGLSINGSTVNFAPGTYTFQGPFSVSGSTITGADVSFYQQSGSFTISGTSIQSLSAPLTGPTQGMLLAEPPSNTSGMTLNGTNALGLQGGIYLPGGVLTTNGSPTAWLFMAAASIRLNGKGISVPNSDFPGGKHVALAD